MTGSRISGQGLGAFSLFDLFDELRNHRRFEPLPPDTRRPLTHRDCNTRRSRKYRAVIVCRFLPRSHDFRVPIAQISGRRGLWLSFGVRG